VEGWVIIDTCHARMCRRACTYYWWCLVDSWGMVWISTMGVRVGDGGCVELGRVTLESVVAALDGRGLSRRRGVRWWTLEA
jgi:hypothetical protein